MNPDSGSRGRRAFWALLALLMAVTLVPAAAQAKVKPKDGYFIKDGPSTNPFRGYIRVVNGKVTSSSLHLAFKTKDGETCAPSGSETDLIGFANVYFDAKKKVRPSRKGKFKITNKKSGIYPGLKGTVTGRFKSSKRATFKVTVKSGDCSATQTFRNASQASGG
ncbi:MAG: hypothetical protein ACSLFI_07450 [Solirubrobacterales bacterium]